MQTTRPTNLTREQRLEVMLRSKVAERTLRNYLAGRARPASAARIEQALRELEQETATATPPSSG